MHAYQTGARIYGSRSHCQRAFQPFLRSDGMGEISFSFRTSDKLSTYYVAVYAHDKDVRNAFVREEMVVSVPVKVSVSAPRYLYDGDLIQLAANVSSNAEAPVSGTLYLYVYDSADHAAKPVSTQRIPLKVPAGGSLAKTFAVRLPKADTVGLKTVFVAREFSDAVFQSVPVLPRVQTLTEAHSAVLLAGMDEKALLRELRSRFVNVPAKQAESSVITVLDMVRDAIPDHVDPEGNDVISLSEAYYTRLLAARLIEADGVQAGPVGDVFATRVGVDLDLGRRSAGTSTAEASESAGSCCRSRCGTQRLAVEDGREVRFKMITRRGHHQAQMMRLVCVRGRHHVRYVDGGPFVDFAFDGIA